MTENQDELQRKINYQRDNLTKLGLELGKTQFSYKIKEKKSPEYWQNRIIEFKKHREQCIEYYSQAHTLMNLIDKEKAILFLLSISKLHQLGSKLERILQEIKQNPTIVHSNDKQKSKWSQELRENFVNINNECLNNEKEMSKQFRTFYETNFKKLEFKN